MCISLQLASLITIQMAADGSGSASVLDHDKRSQSIVRNSVAIASRTQTLIHSTM